VGRGRREGERVVRESADATCCLVWWLVCYNQGFLSIVAAADTVPVPPGWSRGHSPTLVDPAVLFCSQDGEEG